MDEWRTAGKNAGPAPQDDYLAIDIAKDRLTGWRFNSNMTNEKSAAFCGESDRLEGSSTEEVKNA